jgi:small-conductance mechanosensitive channel
LLASRAISDEGAFGSTSAGRWIKQTYNTEDSKLDQLGVLASVIINLLIVAAFLPVILFQWGFQGGDMAVWMRRLANGFQIGTFTFSPLAIITGLIVFGVGYFITRWFQSWIDDTVMARGRVDAGVRNSIRTVVGYAGLAVATLIGISAAGLNLSNLALIAGGLSLGIGFGLQNVVSNFVSGLILLVERPFKVGDWVVAGDISGTVRKISVRATEIETFQRQTVILPNSQLINNAVGNWTHRNRLGRVEVPVGVVYGSDAEHVQQVLLDLARGSPLVLKNPEPFVLFTGFTDTAMNFEIRVFLADISNGSSVQNELRFGILKAFEREGIVIAHAPRPAPPAPSPGWSADEDKGEAVLRQRLEKRADELASAKSRPRKRKPDPA